MKNKSHIPNKETEKVMKDTEKGKNIISHKTLKDFWRYLGF